MGGLVVQPQWKLRDDTLRNVCGPIEAILLTEDGYFVGENPGGVTSPSCQGKRFVTAQEQTRRGRE